MKKLGLIFLLLLPSLLNAQKAGFKKQQTIKAIKKNNLPKVDDKIIRTNNSDTLFLEIDNAIILTPKQGQPKTEFYIKASQGTINKLTTNFYQLGNLKENKVTITAFETATNKLVEERVFVVSKQMLPF